MRFLVATTCFAALTLGCGASKHTATSDASVGSASVDGGDAGNSDPERTLAKLQTAEYATLMAEEGDLLYVAVYTPAAAEVCSTSRWLRIAKDGSNVEDLGPTGGCHFLIPNNVVMTSDRLYWLDWDGTSPSLMSFPKAGGRFARVATYPGHLLMYLVGGGDALYATERSMASDLISIVRIGYDGQTTTIIPEQGAIGPSAVIGGSLFWLVVPNPPPCASCRHEIRVSPLDGGPSSVVFPSMPLDLQIHAADGWLYFIQGERRVGRVSPAGKVEEVTQLIPITNRIPLGGQGSLRVVRGEALLSNENGANSWLATAPRQLAWPSFTGSSPDGVPWSLDSSVFEVDATHVFFTAKGGIHRLRLP
jgi:hypothetical protein